MVVKGFLLLAISKKQDFRFFGATFKKLKKESGRIARPLLLIIAKSQSVSQFSGDNDCPTFLQCPDWLAPALTPAQRKQFRRLRGHVTAFIARNGIVNASKGIRAPYNHATVDFLNSLATSLLVNILAHYANLSPPCYGFVVHDIFKLSVLCVSVNVFFVCDTRHIWLNRWHQKSQLQIKSP